MMGMLARAAAALLSASLASAVVLACSSDDPSSPGASSGGSSSGGSSSGGSSSGGSSSGDPAPVRSLGAPESGEATYYDADGSGNCSFDASPGDLMVAALNATQYAKASVCGACMRVTGAKGSTVVRIVDKCPGCRANGGIDLSREAFAAVDEPSRGRVAVTLEPVTCVVAGALAFRFKEGSSKYWTAIQVRNHRLPIKSVEWDKAGAWQAMERADYNYFLAASGVGDQPSGLRLRITASDGQAVTETLPAIEAGAVSAGTQQFR